MASPKKTDKADIGREVSTIDTEPGAGDRVRELRERAIAGGKVVAQGVKSGSVKVYQVARARPRLTAGLLILGGVALTAFLLRKRIPGATEKLTAAVAGVAIAAGAPEALDRLKKAGTQARKSKLVKRGVALAKETPDRLNDLGRGFLRSKPVQDLAERVRRA